MRRVDNKIIAYTSVKREDILTGLSYDDLVAAFEGELGWWNPLVESSQIQQAHSWEERRKVYQRMTEPHGLIIFNQLAQDHTATPATGIRKCSLYLIGNPVITEQILRIDVRASLYLPFRVCLYVPQDLDHAIISFERPSSFIAALRSAELMKFGYLLDKNMDSVVQSILNRHH
ncbi:DUF302 domain-containing protein [bacterium BFN5]|nr:DUF302 domain-containing protein [bacterium BFN5]QJW49005.1 DUF302 domain-containing protein [bacterium BFN5]